MSTNGARSDRSSSGTGDAGKALCDACAKLHLGVHRFKVQSWPSRRSGNPAADRALRSSPTSQSLNSLQRIQDKEKVCKLCELILNSVRADLNKLTGENANEIVCSITWEIDGREVAASSSSSNGPRNSVRGLTRRMHIRWNNKHLSEAYLVYEAPESSARTVSDADRVWDKDSLFLGRKVAPGVENQALIHSWLGLCCNTHQGPCRDEGSQKDHQRFHSMLSHSYFGVIDVHNMQLTQLPYEATETDDTVILSSQPYIALSYVWGATQKAYTTDTGNVMLHRTHGGLEKVRDALPEVIRDAIDLVRRLGYQYLWIDRLCIVQDSPRSWKLNAYNMDVIYGNAFLTICAADGDSTAGLRAMRPESHNADQLGATVQPGLSLLVTRPPEMHIRTSQWNERAWTFQERLLSKRCLIFANGRVYFQCRSTGMSEDIYADRKGAGWSLDLVNAPLQIFRQLDYRAIWVYMRCVRLYTERRLSKPRDILAAFNGMSNLMCDRMELPFIHGLPSSHFDIALLWEPVRNTKRRQVPDPENSSLSALDFPSWSWAGWEGSVDYKHNIVGDLLDNVSEWLDNHTWIDWWVRDGHGDLRPLWDDSLEGARSSVGGKWSGYRRRGSRRFATSTFSGRQPRNNERYRPNEEERRETIQSESKTGWEADGIRDDVYSSSDPGQRSEDENGYEDEDEDSRHVVHKRGEEDRERRPSVAHRSRRAGTRQASPSSSSMDGQRHHRHGSLLRERTRPRSEHYVSPAMARSTSPRRARPQSYIVPRFRGSHLPQPAPSPGKVMPNGIPSPPPSEEREMRSRTFSSLPRPVLLPSQRFDTGKIELPPPPGLWSRSRSRFHSMGREHRTNNTRFLDRLFENDGEEFSITLRDYPYRVVKAPFDPDAADDPEYPLLPILQFRTWHTWLHIASTDQAETDKQTRYHIVDEVGDWCGSILLDASQVAGASSRQEFIAISHAKNFTLDECHEWTYYIPKEREESEWDLFYVLLIKRQEEKWERVGLGKVFKEAFRNAKWKEIMLA